METLVSKIVDFEMGNLTGDETIDLFQELIDSGMVWKLQGSYGRMATALIEEGICVQG